MEAFNEKTELTFGDIQIRGDSPKNCPTDTVFWLNLSSGIFHYKGQHSHAYTKHGAYVWEKEAVKEQKRPSKRGEQLDI